MTARDPHGLLKASPEALAAFLERRIPEDEGLDYKRDMSGDFAKTIAAMANTNGGIIVFGVDEDKATKTPKAWQGFRMADPRGAVANQVRERLDGAVSLHTHVVAAEGDRMYLVVVVEPSLSRAILHKDSGPVVRHHDQSVAPSRDAFEGLLRREAGNVARTAIDDGLVVRDTGPAAKARAAEGRAGQWSGPGTPTPRLTVVVAIEPHGSITLRPSEALDDRIAGAGAVLMGGGFHPMTEEGHSAAERPWGHAEVLPDRISVGISGAIDVRACAQPPGWTGHVPEPWMLDADQLASDVVRALLVPAVLGADLDVLFVPAGVAVAFTGFQGKGLYFPRKPGVAPTRPMEGSARRAPVYSATLNDAKEVVTVAVDSIRLFARFLGQRGADAWADGVVARLTKRQDLQRWHGLLTG
jgi:hypothetical protein